MAGVDYLIADEAADWPADQMDELALATALPVAITIEVAAGVYEHTWKIHD